MLEFRNVHLSYGKKPLLVDLNLSVGPGETATIVGENGAGKTSILRSIFDDKIISSGSVFIENSNNNEITPIIRSQKISVLFAKNPIAKEITTRDILKFSLSQRCMGPQEIKKSFDEATRVFRIEKMLDLRVHELSEGMLQRAMIARTFCLDTPIIYLDEPTTYLDIKSQVEIADIISEIVIKKSKSLIINTHNSLWVKRFSKNIYQIKDKRIIKSNIEELNLF